MFFKLSRKWEEITVRIWNYRLLPYLSELQFKGQLRELVLIMRQWRDKGTTNHILINKIMEYDKTELYSYFILYYNAYKERYNKTIDSKVLREFEDFGGCRFTSHPFENWHTKEYLRSNMANLWEKHFMGVGKSRISDEECETLLRGYKEITGEEYSI